MAKPTFWKETLWHFQEYPGKTIGLALLLIIFGIGLGALAVNLSLKAVGV